MSRQREYLADASSVELTRNPRGLERALAKIAGDREVLEVANRATQHLYFTNPIKKFEERSTSLFSTHPSIVERINRLRAADRRAAARRERRPRARGARLTLAGRVPRTEPDRDPAPACPAARSAGRSTTRPTSCATCSPSRRRTIPARSGRSGSGPRPRRTPSSTRLFDAGAFVRTHVMRPTWHFVAPEDIRWLLDAHRAARAPGERLPVPPPGARRRARRRAGRGAGAGARGRRGAHPRGARHALRGGRDRGGRAAPGLPASSDAELDAGHLQRARGREAPDLRAVGRAGARRAGHGSETRRSPSSAGATSRATARRRPWTSSWWSGLTMADARAALELATPPLLRETIDGRAFYVAAGARRHASAAPLESTGRPPAAELRRAAHRLPRPHRRDGPGPARRRGSPRRSWPMSSSATGSSSAGGRTRQRSTSDDAGVGPARGARSPRSERPSRRRSGACETFLGGPARRWPARLRAGRARAILRHAVGLTGRGPRRAEIAQLVEHATENRGVASSTLALGTNIPASRSLRAEVAQLVEHHLAKVRVAGSSPVFRSILLLRGL